MANENNTPPPIKVGDLISLKEKDIIDINNVILILSNLSKDYQKIEDVHNLENLKKEFNGHLEFMARLYSKTKRFKGSNHTYLEEAKKKVKAESLDILLSSGSKITNAEKMIYGLDYYKERIDLLEKLSGIFIKVENLYEQYRYTLQCIVQSISVAAKERQNSDLSNA